jgi:hypothetical protein
VNVRVILKGGSLLSAARLSAGASYCGLVFEYRRTAPGSSSLEICWRQEVRYGAVLPRIAYPLIAATTHHSAKRSSRGTRPQSGAGADDGLRAAPIVLNATGDDRADTVAQPYPDHQKGSTGTSPYVQHPQKPHRDPSGRLRGVAERYEHGGDPSRFRRHRRRVLSPNRQAAPFRDG